MRRNLLRTAAIAVLVLALAGCAAKAVWKPLFESFDPNRTPGLINSFESAGTEETEDPNKLFTTDTDAMDDPRIVVYKSRHVLELVDGGIVMARMTVALGKHEGPKTKSGDGKTPEGLYYICKLSDEGRYHKSLFISYPNSDDAQLAFQAERITQDQYDKISNAIDHGEIPPWNTKLGGEIAVSGTGTMGEGKTGDWTAGNVVLSDKDVDYLWQFVKEGTEVEIVP